MGQRSALWKWRSALLRRHNERHGVSNHRRHYFLLNGLFGHKLKKTSKVRVTGLCEGNSPVTGEFPVQKGRNGENVSIWWRHHENDSFAAAIEYMGFINITVFFTCSSFLMVIQHNSFYTANLYQQRLTGIRAWMSVYTRQFHLDVIIYALKSMLV